MESNENIFTFLFKYGMICVCKQKQFTKLDAREKENIEATPQQIEE